MTSLVSFLSTSKICAQNIKISRLVFIFDFAISASQELIPDCLNNKLSALEAFKLPYHDISRKKNTFWIIMNSIDINHLTDIWLANIFFPFPSFIYLFIFLILSFAVQQSFSWTSSHLVLMLFVFQVSNPKTHCQDPCYEVFFLCFLLEIIRLLVKHLSL